MTTLPKIAISTGDPAGVGPEISLQAVADEEVSRICQPILYGDATVLQAAAQKLNLPFPVQVTPIGRGPESIVAGSPAVCDFDSISLTDFRAGTVNAQTGASSFLYFDTAINHAMAQRIAAIVTGPIHKEAINSAGHRYPGHTEILADRAGGRDPCMMLTSRQISCSFVTTHVGLHEVPGLISEDKVLHAIQLTHDALRRIQGRSVSLICCALNPHAGEGGLFGRREEEIIIRPALERARSQGISIEGPLPADTAFLRPRRERTDGYVCMYHDQGNIPLKALAFDDAVNVTLGLPIIRTSVDHGTACDIAWTGRAGFQSMIEAIKLAVQLVTTRTD